MNHRARAIIQTADVLLGFFCLVLAYGLIYHQNLYLLELPFTAPRSVQDLCSILLMALGWHGTFVLAGLYRADNSPAFSIRTRPINLASALAVLPPLLCWLVTREGRRSDLVHALMISSMGAVLLAFMMRAVRLALSAIMRYMVLRGAHVTHVLVVGANNRSMKFVQDSLQHPERGFHFQGFVDDGWFSDTSQQDSPIALCGTLADLPELLRQISIDEVCIALPIASFYARITEIVALCETHGIRARVVGRLFEAEGSHLVHTTTEAAPVTTVHDPAWSEVASFFKRAFDIAVSAGLLLLLLPLLLVVAAAISWTSDGPALFTQTRLGFGKRQFKILKFRTMVTNAGDMLAQLQHLNETGGPTFKLKNDPRITKVGGFLRRTSLDELPQLVNVLLGDMSMVGPRPLPLRDYAGFSDDRHRRRFSVKPGITCLWQVMGRSSITFDQWMLLDAQYIDQRTFWLDMKILLQTVPAVLRGSGAV